MNRVILAYFLLLWLDSSGFALLLLLAKYALSAWTSFITSEAWSSSVWTYGGLRPHRPVTSVDFARLPTDFSGLPSPPSELLLASPSCRGKEQSITVRPVCQYPILAFFGPILAIGSARPARLSSKGSGPRWAMRVGDHPFKAPPVNPLTKLFWKIRNMTITGREMISTPADIRP